MVIKKVNLDIVIGVTSQVPETDLPEVAFAGKSNVGKSSLERHRQLTVIILMMQCFLLICRVTDMLM